MKEENSVENAKGAMEIVANVVKVAGDSPDAKEAATNLGKSAATVTKAINNVLLPIAAVNFAFDKAKIYFDEKFQSEFEEKARNIAPENLIEPKGSIAGPVLQGLAFTHEEPNLKDMYLNLLASAMDSNAAANAHPGFVEIIKQLSAEEADLIKGALLSQSPIAIAQIHKYKKDNSGYNTLLRHLINLKDGDTQEAKLNQGIPAMIDNWIRLGLVEVSYDKFLTKDEEYSWVESRPEYTKLSEQYAQNGDRVEFQKGIIQRTELGRMFSVAIGLS